MLPNTFYEASITFVPIKKGTLKETFRPTLINTGTNILNKMLANQIQQHIKRLIYNDQVGFSLGMKVDSNVNQSNYHIYQLKKNDHRIHLNRE